MTNDRGQYCRNGFSSHFHHSLVNNFTEARSKSYTNSKKDLIYRHNKNYFYEITRKVQLMWKISSNLNADIFETHEPGQHIYCKQLQQFQIFHWVLWVDTLLKLCYLNIKNGRNARLETAFSEDIALTKLLAIVDPMLVPVYGRRVLWKSRPSRHQLYGWLHRLSSGSWSRLLTNEPLVSNNKRTGLGKFI